MTMRLQDAEIAERIALQQYNKCDARYYAHKGGTSENWAKREWAQRVYADAVAETLHAEREIAKFTEHDRLMDTLGYCVVDECPMCEFENEQGETESHSMMLDNPPH